MISEKELLQQVLNREISNLLSSINPAFRMFSGTLTNYIMDFINPYVDAFTNADGEINKPAASGFLKQEVNEKVEAFMKKFEAESEKNNGRL
jgi:hypothetical protein